MRHTYGSLGYYFVWLIGYFSNKIKCRPVATKLSELIVEFKLLGLPSGTKKKYKVRNTFKSNVVLEKPNVVLEINE